MSKNLEIIQAMYAAWGRGDGPAFLEHIHEDCDWEYVDGGVPWLTPGRGRAGVAAFLQAAGTELEVTRFEPKAFLEAPGYVAVVFDIDCTVRRNGQLIREIDEVHLWQLDDRGRVIKFRHCANTAMQQRAWSAPA